MLKRTITGFFILLFTVGFIALRQVSPLFFDAFVLVIMYGSVIEMALASKFSDKKIAQVLVFLYPLALVFIYIFSKSVQTALLLQVALALLMFALLMSAELIENAIVRKQCQTDNNISYDDNKDVEIANNNPEVGNINADVKEDKNTENADANNTDKSCKSVGLVDLNSEIICNNDAEKVDEEVKKLDKLSAEKATVNNETEQNSGLLNQTKYSMYIMIYPTTLLGFLMGLNHFGLNLGYIAIIMSFAISMTTDVFAYLFGSLIRGPKMAPEISPKKSISGMVFGALGGILMAGLGYLFFVHFGWFGNAFKNVPLANSIVTFTLMGVFGTFLIQFGDLVASAYKRKVKIKDFGNIFPGHGGFMDRVDGLMFTATLVYVLFALFII